MNKFLYLNKSEKTRFLNKPLKCGEPGLYTAEGIDKLFVDNLQLTLAERIKLIKGNYNPDKLTEHQQVYVDSLEEYGIEKLDGNYNSSSMKVVKYWIERTPCFSVSSGQGDSYFSISSRQNSNFLRWGTFRCLPDVPDFEEWDFPGLENVSATVNILEFTIEYTKYWFQVAEPPRDEFGRIMCQNSPFPSSGFVYFEDYFLAENSPWLEFPDNFEVQEFFEWARFNAPCQFSKIVDRNADGVHGFFCLTCRPGLSPTDVQRVLDRFRDRNQTEKKEVEHV